MLIAMASIITPVIMTFTLWTGAQGDNGTFTVGSCDSFGVAFSPYVKGPYSNWVTDYTEQELITMLQLIVPYHNRITTYGMGGWYGTYNNTWYSQGRNCLIARAAGRVNELASSLVITVAQGIYQLQDCPTQHAQDAEIRNAISSADDANTLYPGTVDSLVFTNEYINDEVTANGVYNLILKWKNVTVDHGLKIGFRTHRCSWMVETSDDPNIQSTVQVITKIAQLCDFVMCNIYPPAPQNSNPIAAATNLIQDYRNIKLAFEQATPAKSPKLQVIIGETGCASYGLTFNNVADYNTQQNECAYWKSMRAQTCAEPEPVVTYMFEAFDEPWKYKEGEPYNIWPGEAKFGRWSYSLETNTFFDKFSVCPAPPRGQCKKRHVKEL